MGFQKVRQTHGRVLSAFDSYRQCFEPPPNQKRCMFVRRSHRRMEAETCCGLRVSYAPLTWMPATHAVTYVSLKHAEAYASQTHAVCTTRVSDACCKICVPDARYTACHTPALGSRQKPSVIITGLSLDAIAVSLVTMHPDVCMHARMCVNVERLICICACILTRMSESGRACVSIFECRCACLHGYMDACHAQMV